MDGDHLQISSLATGSQLLRDLFSYGVVPINEYFLIKTTLFELQLYLYVHISAVKLTSSQISSFFQPLTVFLPDQLYFFKTMFLRTL